MHTIKRDTLPGSEDQIPRVVTLTNARYGDPFADVRCSEGGEITLYHERDERRHHEPKRDSQHHHDIKGLNEGRLDFEGKTLVILRGKGWYAWTFHPRGVLLCYPDRLDLVVLAKAE